LNPEEPAIRAAKVILISARNAVLVIKKSLARLSASVTSVDAFVVQQQRRDAIDQLKSLFVDDRKSIENVRGVLTLMVNKGVSEGVPSFAIHSASRLIQTRLEQQLTETSVYEPTKCFLEQLWSRISNGAALAFYE
jgi:transcriptional accessory protein Tex/SPT6